MNTTISAERFQVTKKQVAMIGLMLIALTFMCTITPAFARPELAPELTNLLTEVIGYIGIIFRVVGILFLAYSIGQMIMGFKDDNPDAKAKASTMMVVAFILISVPTILEKFNLVSLL